MRAYEIQTFKNGRVLIFSYKAVSLGSRGKQVMLKDFCFASQLHWSVISQKSMWLSCVCAQLLSCARLFATPWTVTHHPSVHGTLQARILEWVAISTSWGSSRPSDQTCVSCTAGTFFTTEPPGKPGCGDHMLANRAHRVASKCKQPHGLVEAHVGSKPGNQFL